MPISTTTSKNTDTSSVQQRKAEQKNPTLSQSPIAGSMHELHQTKFLPHSETNQDENQKYRDIFNAIKSDYKETRDPKIKLLNSKLAHYDVKNRSKEDIIAIFNEKLAEASFNRDPLKEGAFVLAVRNNPDLMKEYRIRTTGEEYRLVPKESHQDDPEKLQALKDIYTDIRSTYKKAHGKGKHVLSKYLVEDMKTVSDVIFALNHGLNELHGLTTKHSKVAQLIKNNQALKQYCELHNGKHGGEFLVEIPDVVSQVTQIHTTPAPRMQTAEAEFVTLPAASVQHSVVIRPEKSVAKEVITDIHHEQYTVETQVAEPVQLITTTVQPVEHKTAELIDNIYENSDVTVTEKQITATHHEETNTASPVVSSASSSVTVTKVEEQPETKAIENNSALTNSTRVEQPSINTASPIVEEDDSYMQLLNTQLERVQSTAKAIPAPPGARIGEKIKAFFGFGSNRSLLQGQQAIITLREYNTTFNAAIEAIKQYGAAKNEPVDQTDKKIAVFKTLLSNHQESKAMLKEAGEHIAQLTSRGRYVWNQMKELTDTGIGLLALTGVMLGTGIGVAIGVLSFVTFTGMAIIKYSRAAAQYQQEMALRREYDEIIKNTTHDAAG